MWFGLSVLAVAVVAAVWLLGLWMDRRYDRHVEDALALANARQRHPASRRRCRCGRFMLADRWQLAVGDDHGEPFHHTQECCQPVRDVL